MRNISIEYSNNSYPYFQLIYFHSVPYFCFSLVGNIFALKNLTFIIWIGQLILLGLIDMVNSVIILSKPFSGC